MGQERPTFKEVADELIRNGTWNAGPRKNIKDAVVTYTYEMLSMALLIDIAESLRILRCPNVQQIPQVLKGIERNTTHKKRRRRHA